MTREYIEKRAKVFGFWVFRDSPTIEFTLQMLKEYSEELAKKFPDLREEILKTVP